MTTTHFFDIAEKIATTNNGKLMLQNLTRDERAEVPELVNKGLLRRATFLDYNDAIRLS